MRGLILVPVGPWRCVHGERPLRRGGLFISVPRLIDHGNATLGARLGCIVTTEIDGKRTRD
jgi:hypothetical protein